MNKYIKNNSGGNKTWVGQLLADQEYYQLQSHEEIQWANNSSLLSDIGSGSAIVAKDDSGNNDITDVSCAIDYLRSESDKNEDGIPIVAPTFEETGGLTTVWKGHLYTATAGALNIFDEVVTTQIKVRGGWYELMDTNAAVGDYIEFSIVDKDNVLGLFATYGLTEGVDVLELKKFIRNEYVNSLLSGRQDFESHAASTVYAGLYTRVSYYSNGVTDVKFKVMEKYHEI